MAGKIKLDHHERLLVDEFQDMSTLALDIIKAIPADQKIFVGDSNQAVFEFLKLTDGFSHFPEAKVLTLSKSFRVSNKYAPAIQDYLRNHLEPDAVFEGMDYSANVKPITKAYLTRTNASLIGKMIELNKQNIPYNLSTKAKLSQMFKLPLALIYAKPGFDQKDPELKHLQHDIDDWGSLPLAKRAEMSLFSYLKQTNPNDNKLISALMLILKFDRQDIIDAYKHAEEHKGTACNLSLLTAHTSKGSTFDIVELDDDINESVSEVMQVPITHLTNSERSELCLGFVSISRHRHQLINCKFLGDIND
jgi:superfamily I DNA/RNA helicase